MSFREKKKKMKDLVHEENEKLQRRIQRREDVIQKEKEENEGKKTQSIAYITFHYQQVFRNLTLKNL